MLEQPDGVVNVAFQGDTSQLDATCDKATNNVKAAAAAIGNALLTIGKASFAAGVDFESAFAGVKKTVDASAMELDILREGIIRMSEELPSSASEIAKVAESAGQLGIETDKILAFSKAMIDLGQATNLTASEAATELARFANITGMSKDEFDKLGSVIVALGNNMATTEAEIVAMASNLAGAASQAGMTEAEIMAISAAMSSIGQDAAAGGTAISKLVTDINIAVQTGGEDLEKFANVANMSISDFSELFKEDAAKALSIFITGLGNMEERGSSTILTLQDLGIEESRMVNALLGLSGASTELNKALELGGQAWEENIALTNEAAQRYETTESKIAMLKNQLTNGLIEIFDSFYPLIQEILPVIKNLLVQITPLISGLIKSILPLLSDFMEKLLPKILELAEQVLPLIVALLEALLPALIEMASKILPILMTFLEPILPLLLLLVKVLEPLLYLFCALLEPVMEFANGVLSFFMNALKVLIDGAIWVVDQIIGIFGNIINFFKNDFEGVWNDIWEKVLSFFKNIWDGIVNAMKAAINFLIDGINGFLSLLNSLKIPDWVPGIGGFSLDIPLIPRFEKGADFIPTDMFPAYLDYGERVLTQEDNVKFNILGGLTGMEKALSVGFLEKQTPTIIVNNYLEADVSMDGFQVGSVVMRNIDDVKKLGG